MQEKIEAEKEATIAKIEAQKLADVSNINQVCDFLVHQRGYDI